MPSHHHLTSGGNDAPSRVEAADPVVRNARIFTGDPARPHAAGLAASNGRITAVGDEADVAGLVGPGTRSSTPSGAGLSPDSMIHTSTSSEVG